MRMITMLVAMFFCTSVFANNLFIPNHYRSDRQLNNFSAIGWSNRSEVGLSIAQENSKDQKGGVDDDKSDTTMISPYVFHRFENGFNTEVGLTQFNMDTDAVAPGATSGKSDGFGYNVNLGYEIPAAPVAVGVNIFNLETNTDPTTGTSTDVDLRNIGLGIGYRLGSNVYLGFGVSEARLEVLNLSTNFQSFAFGIGKVYGDAKKPTATTELALLTSNEDGEKTYGLAMRGLVNSGAIQYVGELGFGGSDDNTGADSLSYNVDFGVDVQWEMLYVFPKISYENEHTNNDTDDSELSASLQAGYRANQIEAFFRYTVGQGEDENTTPALTEKDKSNEITIGARYFF